MFCKVALIFTVSGVMIFETFGTVFNIKAVAVLVQMVQNGGTSFHNYLLLTAACGKMKGGCGYNKTYHLPPCLFILVPVVASNFYFVPEARPFLFPSR